MLLCCNPFPQIGGRGYFFYILCRGLSWQSQMKKINNPCEAKCPFQKTCACHVTAGMWRSENGFTPTLQIKGVNIICHTVDAEQIEVFKKRDILVYPHNYKKLGKGKKELSTT